MSRYEEILEKYPMVSQAMPTKRNFTIVYGYANGHCIGQFKSKPEAYKSGAKAAEEVFDEEGFEKAKQAYNQAKEDFDTEWKNTLRSDYSELSDYVFNLLFEIAWRESHDEGYEAVELTLRDYLEIANMVEHST